MLAVVFDFSKKVGGSTPPISKRGYILDRRGNPLVISLEHYKAYYLLKKGKFFRDKIPAPVRKYFPSTLNLPDKGLVLLSENLSPDEFEELKGIKNVILQRYYKRKLLYPYLEPFVGRCFNNIGISGVEKEFDELLRTGRALRLSLDMNLEKKLLSFVKEVSVPYEIAVINLKTGEVLSFLATSPFSFKERDRIWSLVKNLYAKLCGKDVSPTPLYHPEKVCEPKFSLVRYNPGWYDMGEVICWLKIKGERLYLLALKVEKEKKAIKTLGDSLIASL
jgi:hypothetical protein